MGIFSKKPPPMTAAEKRAAHKQAVKDDKAARKIAAKAQAKAEEQARKEGVKKLKNKVEADARKRSAKGHGKTMSSKEIQETADYTHKFDNLSYAQLEQMGYARARENQYGPHRKYR